MPLLLKRHSPWKLVRIEEGVIADPTEEVRLIKVSTDRPNRLSCQWSLRWVSWLSVKSLTVIYSVPQSLLTDELIHVEPGHIIDRRASDRVGHGSRI
jgi:hypothetical protein